MQIFDVLSSDLAVKDHFFLEASAGTGKTFSIEHLVSRLVIEGIDFKKILIVTFTRAATRELKRRVLATLKEAIKAISGENKSPIPYLEQVRNLPYEEKKEVVQRITNAIQSQTSSSIFTIHGFCYRMLKQFSFEAHSPLRLFDPDEGSTKSLYVEGVVKSFRAQVMEKFLFPAQMQILFAKYRKSFIDLISASLPFLDQSRGALEDVICTKETLTLLQKEFAKICEAIDLDEIESLFSCYKLLMTKDGTLKEEAEAAWKICKEAYEKKDLSFDLCNRWLSHKNALFSIFTFKNRKAKRVSDAVENLMSKVEGALSSWNSLLEPLIDPLRIQLILSTLCKKSMREGWTEEDILLTDDLLSEMKKALTHFEFSHSVQELYDAVIIDEFQDTDPLQWDIFSHLFLNQRKAPVFCLVGDPKQSIYSFRSADLSVFFEAKDSFLSTKHYALKKNFRSSKPLVEGCNHLFSAMPSWFPYYPVESADTLLAAEEEKKGIHFFGTGDLEIKRGIFPSQEAERELYFPYIINEMIRLEKEGTPFHEQVVLVKDRFQARRLEKALKEAHIPVISNAKMNLAESPIFFLFEKLFALLLTPYDMNELKQFLSSPPFLAPASFLERDLSDPFFQEIVSSLHELKEILSEKGFIALLGVFFQKPLSPRLLSLKELLAQEEFFDLYQDAIQLIEILLQASHRFSAGAIDALHFLEKLKAKGGEESKKYLRKPAQEGSCVTLMTTFTSKGLEFSIVFAFGLVTRGTKAPDWVYSKKLGKIIPYEEQDSEALEILHNQEKEKLRQLYVALTRAKKRVYVPFAFSKEEGFLSHGVASPLDIFYASLLEAAVEMNEIYGAIPRLSETTLCSFLEKKPSLFSLEKLEIRSIQKYTPQEVSQVVLVEPEPLLPTKNRERSFSFSSLLKHKILPPLSFLSNDLLPAGPHIGNVFHSLLEKIFQNGWHPYEYLTQRKALIQKSLIQYNLKEHEEAILRIIESALTLPFPGGFSLQKIHPSHVIQEIEFLFPIDERALMKGFIDLIFFEQGKFHILDWKSNKLERYEEPYLQQAMEDHEYCMQGEIYYEALMRYITLLGYNPESDFGGIHYLFLRGPALYSFAPKESFEQLWGGKNGIY